MASKQVMSEILFALGAGAELRRTEMVDACPSAADAQDISRALYELKQRQQVQHDPIRQTYKLAAPQAAKDTAPAASPQDCPRVAASPNQTQEVADRNLTLVQLRMMVESVEQARDAYITSLGVSDPVLDALNAAVAAARCSESDARERYQAH